MTLKELLHDKVRENRERPLLFCEGRYLTYGEFQARVNRVANAFLKMGIRKGDRVVLLLPNCPEFLFSVFAAAEIGAIFVPLNTGLTKDEVGYLLDHSGCSLLIADPVFLPAIADVRDKLASLKRIVSRGKGREPECLSWDEFLFDVPEEAAGISTDPEEIASITYTSGTTGRPKGVMLTQFSYAFAPRKRAEALGWNAQDRAIVVTPLFHVNALCHVAIAILSVGGSIVLEEKFSASQFWDRVREHGVTTSSLMRTIPQILLSLPEKTGDRDNPLRLVVALLSPDIHLRFEERFGLTVIPSYSLTEDILSVLGPLDRTRRKLGSSGLPVAPEVHRLRVVDESGRELPAGRLGEIVKQSPAVMKGYYRDPEATSAVLKEGWLYTGDLGYLDQDGFLYFVDRKKDVIRRGDENISSEEVEQVLCSHPAILEAAVIAVPDPIRQEEVKALIVLKPPATVESLPPEEIWEFCRKRMASFKVPRYLEYRGSLPKTPSSKILKSALRTEESPGVVFDRLERK